MNKKNNFIRILSAIFVISLLFFILTEFMIVIKENYYKDADKKIIQFTKEKKRLQGLKNELSEYKNFDSDYKNFKNENFIIYKKFSSFRKNLQELLSKYNFISSGFNFNGTVILKEFIKVNLSIKLTGQYRELKKFIYDMRNTNKFIYLNSIKLIKLNTNVSGNFSVEVYFVK